MPTKNADAIQALTRRLLQEIGEDPRRQGLLKTPGRVAKAYRDLTRGYAQDVRQVLNGAIFDEAYDEMVLIKDIDVYSLCEHHLLPFFGKCHVAYIPNGRIVGLSKIPRLVDVFARRLQVQERMTSQIANCLKEALDPLGVAVIIEAVHLCMMMRGVEKQNATCVTSTMLGVFRSDRGTRMEFMNLVGRR
ncbi:MAG: GTP cyclohydrolase 1 [Candidatus Omnitrophica bacterium]|nr:GTP cyclohydrolase 1 [Candidatus Omnitrophota bacterium]